MQINQLYKCPVCGNIVGVAHVGGGELVCCNMPMQALGENSVDAAVEKHVPVVEKTEKGIKVRVGEVSHPMEDAHYIEWIEIMFDNRIGRQYLKPGDRPEAEFNIMPETFTVRAYCNLHGLWKNA